MALEEFGGWNRKSMVRCAGGARPGPAPVLLRLVVLRLVVPRTFIVTI